MKKQRAVPSPPSSAGGPSSGRSRQRALGRGTTSKRSALPRVIRRILGFIRYARKSASASAASLFIVDREAGSLRGVLSDWDWTRTSFASSVRDWPTVELALGDGKPHLISRNNASGAEAVWFEPRGIDCTLCIPMQVGGHPVGVLFFDFATPADQRAADLAFLTDVGARCARAISRAPTA